MRYRDFIDILLGTIGYEASMSGKTEFRVGELLDRYGLEIRPQWRETITSDLDDDYRTRMYRHLGPLVQQRISLSGEGISWFEDYEENFTSILEANGLRNPYQEAPNDKPLPPGVAEAKGRIFLTEGDPPSDFGEDGDIFLSTAPASDRIVPLNHNSPDYQEIATKFASISEDVRGVNDAEPEEKERVLNSLQAAEVLWDSAQLRIVQLKVGVLMAVEDAASFLGKGAKAVGAALLVDLIKTFVKNHFDFDLDAL